MHWSPLSSRLHAVWARLGDQELLLLLLHELTVHPQLEGGNSTAPCELLADGVVLPPLCHFTLVA